MFVLEAVRVASRQSLKKDQDTLACGHKGAASEFTAYIVGTPAHGVVEHYETACMYSFPFDGS